MAYKRTSPLPIEEGGTNAVTMGTTDGVVYYDGTSLVTTSAGTANQVLTSNGAGVAPTYQAGAGMVLLSTQTAANSASLIFDSSVITSDYRTYMVQMVGIIAGAGTSGTFTMDMSVDNGSNYLASNYQSGSQLNPWNSVTIFNENSTTTAVIARAASAASYNGYLYLYGLATSGAAYPMYVGQFYLGNGYGNCYGFNSGTPTVNNLRFMYTAGNIASGSISLYGLKQ